jgi:hypothetical protein
MTHFLPLPVDLKRRLNHLWHHSVQVQLCPEAVPLGGDLMPPPSLLPFANLRLVFRTVEADSVRVIQRKTAAT